MNLIYLLTQLLIIISLFLGFIWLYYLIYLDLEEKKRVQVFPTVTIAVPAHNEEETIAHTLDSIFSLNYPKDKLKVIVINDGSKDNTGKILKEYKKKHQNLIIIDKKINEGKAKGLNDALSITDTEFFACVDADSTLDKNSLRNNVKYFYNVDGTLKKNVAAVISVVKVKNPDHWLGYAQKIEYQIMSLYRKLFAYANFLNVTPGVLSVYKTEILRDVNGFDEKSITEDFEVAMKIVKNHYKIEMSTESIAFTNVPLTFKSWWKQRIRWYRGFIETTAKHKDLIFSKEHGAFGIFYIPVTIIAPFVLFLSISLILYKMYLEFSRFLFKLIFAPKTIEWFHFQTIEEYILDTNFYITIPLVILFFIFAYTLIRSFFFAEEKFNVKTFIGILIYLYVYPYLTFLQWMQALYLYIRKKEKKW
ncbi:MAG: glycosyltransferase [Candidatus Woesearchaeota archaeon]